MATTMPVRPPQGSLLPQGLPPRPVNIQRPPGMATLPGGPSLGMPTTGMPSPGMPPQGMPQRPPQGSLYPQGIPQGPPQVMHPNIPTSSIQNPQLLAAALRRRV